MLRCRLVTLPAAPDWGWLWEGSGPI